MVDSFSCNLKKRAVSAKRSGESEGLSPSGGVWGSRPNVPPSRSDQREKQSGSEALPDGGFPQTLFYLRTVGICHLSIPASRRFQAASTQPQLSLCSSAAFVFWLRLGTLGTAIPKTLLRGAAPEPRKGHRPLTLPRFAPVSRRLGGIPSLIPSSPSVRWRRRAARRPRSPAGRPRRPS